MGSLPSEPPGAAGFVASRTSYASAEWIRLRGGDGGEGEVGSALSGWAGQ